MIVQSPRQAFLAGVLDKRAGLGFRADYDRVYGKDQIRAYENGRLAEQHSPFRGERFADTGTTRGLLYMGRDRNRRLEAAYDRVAA